MAVKMNRFLSLPNIFLVFFALAACQTPPPAQAFPELTWAHAKPYVFNVAEIEIKSDFKPSFKAPHVEHLFPVALDAAAMRWAEDRLRAGGVPERGGRVVFTIIEVDAVEVPLEMKEGVEGYFTDEESEKYDVSIEVSLEVRNERGYRDGYVVAAAKRSQTVLEDITLDEREKVWFEMTESLMQELNLQLEANIKAYLEAFLL